MKSGYVINFLSSPIYLEQFEIGRTRTRAAIKSLIVTFFLGFLSDEKELKKPTKTLASLLAYKDTKEYNQNRKRTSTNRGKF